MQRRIKTKILGKISPLHNAAGSQIFPLHHAAGSQISPLHNTAGSQISPLHHAAGSQIKNVLGTPKDLKGTMRQKMTYDAT
jgi:hypothetical protein